MFSSHRCSHVSQVGFPNVFPRSFTTFTLIAVLLGLSVLATKHADSAENSRAPNVILIFCDDLGYRDLGCFGDKELSTPNIDRMAKEGTRFTSFYVSQAVCSASRASLLTGCYSNRVGILGALGPQSPQGINAEEVTLGEMFRSAGYATAIYGKWHLGHHPQFLPTRHGFDDYFGLPYSNDMWPKHPQGGNYPDLPLIAGEKTIALNPDQSQLTKQYTEHAVRFMEVNAKRPFFLYVPHSMPHVPLFASERFAGKSPRGLFGDVIAELDWSVGEILQAVKRLNLDEQTLVIFTSDNGPWLNYGNHAGSALPLREGKGTSFEGGVRVPCVMRWPGRIPAGTECREMAATIDLFPTLTKLAGGKLPDRKLDGLDIGPMMSAPTTTKTPRESYFYYWGQELQAVRSGPWKLHFPHKYRVIVGEPAAPGKPAKQAEGTIDLSLFNLEDDLSESRNVAEAHPDVVDRLQQLAASMRKELGDSLEKKTGAEVRPAGKLNPTTP